jgi:hypothetical protein
MEWRLPFKKLAIPAHMRSLSNDEVYLGFDEEEKRDETTRRVRSFRGSIYSKGIHWKAGGRRRRRRCRRLEN